MPTDPNDPKGLIRESYRIEGISDAECRSILIDWALSLSAEQPPEQAIAALLGSYGSAAPDHPMTQLLQAGQSGMTPRRRGGSRRR